MAVAKGVLEREARINNTKIRVRMFSNRKTLEDYIANGEWPENGVPQLQSILLGELQQQRASIESMINGPTVDHRQFTRLQAYIIALMYAFSPNGRIGAINNLDLDLGTRFANDEVEFALSKKFKTYTVYTFQAISLIDFGKVLLRSYIEIRKKFVQSNAAPIDAMRLLSPDSLLFMSSTFRKINGSAMVIDYFKKHGYKVSSDLVRKMFETDTDRLTQEGLVSPLQQEAVHRIMGHSAATAQRSYIIPSSRAIALQRTQDAAVATTVMQRMLNRPVGRSVDIDIDAILEMPGIETTDKSDIESIDWGKAHKCWHVKPNHNGVWPHIPWDVKEFVFIGLWCEKAKAQGMQHNVVGKCRMSLLKEYPEMHKHFHAQHVLSITKFEYGYERYCKYVKQQQQQLPTNSDDTY